jgi:hypothetical protein
MKSPNPKGRPMQDFTNTTETERRAKRMLAIVIKKLYPPQKVIKLLNQTDAKFQLTWLSNTFPYIMPKLNEQKIEASIDYNKLSDNDLQEVYERVMAGAAKSLFTQNPILELFDAVIKDESIETIDTPAKKINEPQG